MDTASAGETRRAFGPELTTMLHTLTGSSALEPGTLPSLEVWSALLEHLTHATSQLPFESVLNSVPIQIVVFDAQHRYLFCNPEAIKNEQIRSWIIGKDDFEYCAHRGFDLSIAEGRRERFLRAVESRAVMSWEETFTNPQGEIVHHQRNLVPIFDAAGELQFVLGYGRDITEQKRAQDVLERFNSELEARVEARTAELEDAKARLEAANTQLQHDAFHDALTGLPNRALFKDRLTQAVERNKRRADVGFAVLFLDFDRFKIINDSLGHDAGDTLLVALGERLKGCVRPGDTVARLGGDEFTLLLGDLNHAQEAVKTAERIQRALKRPFTLSGQEVVITVSIGIVSSDLGYSSAEEVLRDADLAMYGAKAKGRAGYQFFTPAMREAALRRLALETELRNALDTGTLEVQYQPVVAVEDAQPVGFEALARWSHPAYGPVSPETFIPLAEEAGLILELDLFVLREACLQVRAWQERFPRLPPLTLSANLSGKSFVQPEVVARIEAILSETDFDPRNLKLEITESVLVGSTSCVGANLERLRALNIQLHIDDFGTGYSSLSYLQHLPVNTLKVDRSFVAEMLESSESGELVRTVVAMAKALGLTVTVEGVETSEQLEHLKALGCEHAQGYLFSRPLEAEAIADYMVSLNRDELTPVIDGKLA